LHLHPTAAKQLTQKKETKAQIQKVQTTKETKTVQMTFKDGSGRAATVKYVSHSPSHASVVALSFAFSCNFTLRELARQIPLPDKMQQAGYV
jgi:hypothetical protein